MLKKSFVALLLLAVVGISTHKEWYESARDFLANATEEAGSDGPSESDLRQRFAQNLERWKTIKADTARLLTEYGGKKSSLLERLEFCKQKLDSCAEKFRQGEAKDFPVMWLGEWYGRNEMLDQINSLLDEKDRIAKRMDAYQRSLAYLEDAHNEAINKIVDAEINSDLLPTEVVHNQIADANSSNPAGEFAFGSANKRPNVLSLDQILAEESRLSANNERLQEIEDLLAGSSVENASAAETGKPDVERAPAPAPESNADSAG